MTTKWTVKPFYTPHEDSDPLGVFEVKEVKVEAEKWEDASMDAAPNSEQEQHAIDRKCDVTEQAIRLIAAAPELLEELCNAREWLDELCGLIQSGMFDAASDWVGANAVSTDSGLAATIAKATSEPVMAA